jgi:hypothetical protein
MQGAGALQEVVAVCAEAIAEVVQHLRPSIPYRDVVAAIEMHQATWSLFDEGVEQCLGERLAFIDMRPMVLVYVSVVGQDMMFANQDSRRLTYIGVVNAGNVEAWLAVLLQYVR